MGQMRSRWAAVGAAVAVTLGAGGVSLGSAVGTGPKPVYVSLAAPCRIVDTRPGPGQVGAKQTPVGAGEPNAYEIRITGANGQCTGDLAIPSDAVAVSLNVTAIDPTTASNFRLYPADADFPLTSNLNFAPGRAPLANKVDVGLSSTGRIRLANAAGTAHVAVDVFGYYVDHDHGDLYYAKAETYTRAQVDTALADKAEIADVYTRTAIDGLLDDKADTTDVYTRSEVDTALDDLTAEVSPAQVIWVASNGTGDFASVSAALASITDNTSAKPYVIRIAPGTYVETTPIVTKSYVDLQGSGRGVTTLRCACDGASFDTSAVIQMASRTEISDLTVLHPGGTGHAAAVHTSGSNPMRLDDVALAAIDTTTTGSAAALSNSGSAPTVVDSVLYTLVDEASTVIYGYGVLNGAVSAPELTNVEILVESLSGATLTGVFDQSGSATRLFGVTVDASSYALRVDASSPVVIASELNGPVFVIGAASVARILDSRMEGMSISAGKLRVANTMVTGTVTGPVAPVCVGAYDEAFLALSTGCA